MNQFEDENHSIIAIEAFIMIQDNNLIEDINSLPPKEKAEVIDLVKRLKSKQMSSKKWKEIAGLASYPLIKEDAQQWISHNRQESDRI